MSGYLDTAQVAAMAKVTPATIRSYRSRGYLPEPDAQLGQSPGWAPETIAAWLAARPGKGAGAGRPRKAPR